MLMTNSGSPQTHPFERTLGQGPYRFVGAFTIHPPTEQQPQGNLHMLTQFMHPRFVRGCGTCAHCGMAIMNVFQVQIGNGDVFGVGSDCIYKVGMEAKELTKVEKARRDHDKKLRVARKARKGETARLELKELIGVHGDTMSKLPHPSNRADLTLLNYATWVLDHSSDGGIVLALARVKNALKGSI